MGKTISSLTVEELAVMIILFSFIGVGIYIPIFMAIEGNILCWGLALIMVLYLMFYIFPLLG